LDVSVFSGRRTLQLNPSRLSAGPVVFNIANQSGHWERFTVVRRDGRRVAQTPPIPNGGTAQIKATLRGSSSRYALGVSSHRARAVHFTYVRLTTSGRPRNGNSQLLQP
jgi:hypothetical protein